jgi:hypothetical protein
LQLQEAKASISIGGHVLRQVGVNIFGFDGDAWDNPAALVSDQCLELRRW